MKPNTLLTPTTTTKTTTTSNNDVRQLCEQRVRDKLLETFDDELVEVLESLGTFEDVVQRSAATIEARERSGGNDVLPVEEWVDRIILVTLDSGACDHILDLGGAGLREFPC